jgi:hypothetical protein
MKEKSCYVSQVLIYPSAVQVPACLMFAVGRTALLCSAVCSVNIRLVHKFVRLIHGLNAA